MGKKEQVAQIFPAAVDYHNRGQLEQAAELYLRILKLDKRNADALHLHGLTRYQRGDYDTAIRQIKAALKQRRDPLFFFNLGKCYADSSRDVEAIESYRMATRLRPDYVEAYDNLANCHVRCGAFDEAITCLRRSLALRPDVVATYHSLAKVLQAAHRNYEARELYLQLAEREGGETATLNRLRAALSLPSIFDDKEHERTIVQRFDEELAALEGEQALIDDPVVSLDMMPFNLHYTGVNIRPQLERLASLYRRLIPELNYRKPVATGPSGAGSPLRIGFLTAYFYDHSVSYYFKNLICGLDPEEFEVVLLQVTREGSGEMLTEYRQAAQQVVELPRQLEAAQQAIAEVELDLLCFVELGQDPESYYLAFGRYAPIQVALAGHPVTSGLDTIDYYFSHTGSESDSPADDYTEQLRLLDASAAPVCFPAPEAPASRLTRESSGLPEGRVYLCPQMLMKIHPDMDALFAAILERDEEGWLVLVETHAPYREALERRFATTLGELAGRVRFIPMVNGSGAFLHLLQLADVVLDTIHFSGGRSSFDAFSADIPVVTRPGRHLRGRQTLGLYRVMGLEELVAESDEAYVDMALRVAREPEYRRSIAERIAAAKGRLFNDRGSIDFFQQSLLELVR